MSTQARSPAATDRLKYAGARIKRISSRALWLLKQESAAYREREDYRASIDKIRHLTMVPEFALMQLGRIVRSTVSEGIDGAFVECGTWRGGAAFYMADLLARAGDHDRKIWLFDSFEGNPPPDEIDGAAALAYATNTDSPDYLDNARADVEDVRRNARALGFEARTEIVKGWFDDTLPARRADIGPIAILRVDCDWYASVRCCLDNLYDQVVEGGYVIFDDYYSYDGCTLAVHEFLAERKVAHRLEAVYGPPDTNRSERVNGNVFFRKL
jgi:hypothetical protein